MLYEIQFAPEKGQMQRTWLFCSGIQLSVENYLKWLFFIGHCCFSGFSFRHTIENCSMQR